MTTSPRSDRRGALRLPDRLDAEWQRLCQDPSVLTRLAEEPLCGHTDPARLLAASGADRTIHPDDADVVLSQVVREAVRGDGLAARLTLQRILPGLISIARRRRSNRPWEIAGLLDELVATAWVVIATFPIDRRSHHVAGNLCRDVEYRCCVAPERRVAERRRAPLTAAADVEVGPRGRPPHPRDDLADALRDLAGHALSDGDRRLLLELVGGDRLEVVATRLGCTERTVRNRRDRLLAELRARATGTGAGAGAGGTGEAA